MLTRSLPLKHVAFSCRRHLSVGTALYQQKNTSSTISKSSQNCTTLVGPPDPDSNLRPIKVKLNPKIEESQTEKRLRLLREETQEFNQKFWAQHNKEFNQGREEYISKILKERHPSEKKESRSTVSAQEMSTFYKTFLDSKWQAHLDYNLQWQRRNFNILFLAFRVKVENLFQRK